MSAFTHADLTCWICIDNPAMWGVEAKAPAPHATAGETEKHYQLCCDDFSCLALSEAWATTIPRELADVRALTRSEAQVISGLELEVAS